MFAADLMPSLEIYFYFYRVHAYIRNGWASNVVDPDAKDANMKYSSVLDQNEYENMFYCINYI